MKLVTNFAKHAISVIIILIHTSVKLVTECGGCEWTKEGQF